MPRPKPAKAAAILVVEDEPLIVMDISMTMRTDRQVRHAKLLVEHDGTAAILDHALPDGDSTSLCTRLAERGIPYLMYSGFKTLDNACKGAPHLMKPASHEQLLNAMEGLIRNARGAAIGAK